MVLLNVSFSPFWCWITSVPDSFDLDSQHHVRLSGTCIVCHDNLIYCQLVGFFCIRYYEKMMTNRVKDLYHRLLIGKDVSAEMRVQVLNNLGKYLQEEEETCVRAEEEWKKRADNEDLKEMGDVQSG